MKTILASLFMASSLFLAPLTYAETVYQWVDDDGVTQFGSQPPRGRDYRQIRTKTGHSEPVDYSSQYGREEQPEPRTQSANGPTDAELDEACRTARQNLQTLERGGRIAIEDENGERRYLDEEELSERAERARRIQEEAC